VFGWRCLGLEILTFGGDGELEVVLLEELQVDLG
jgi:hypothetical protein